MTEKKTVIIIENNKDWLDSLEELITENFDCVVEPYISFEEAKKRLKGPPPYHLVISDIYPDEDLSNGEGLQFAKFVSSVKKVPVIVVSGVEEKLIKNIKKAYKDCKVEDFFDKGGFDDLEFIQSVKAALEKSPKVQESGRRQRIPPSQPPIESIDTVKKVFISYSHRDKKFVNRLSIGLENAGMGVWLDEKKIKVGDPISKKIEEGISWCDCFCLVISSHSVNSNWVEREYRTALNIQMSTYPTLKILPVLIQNVALPLLLKDIKYADFSRDYNSGLLELLAAIKEK